ncbi:tyrosine-type recombinase/integrase [Tsukamurella ocularis]
MATERVINGRTYYIAQWREDGKSRTKNCESLKAARDYEALVRAGKADSATKLAKVTVRQAVEAWAETAKTESTKHTRLQLSKSLGALGRKKLPKVRRVDVDAWLEDVRDGSITLTGKPWSASTARANRTMLSTVFNRYCAPAMLDGLPGNPVHGTGVPWDEDDGADDAPTRDEIPSAAEIDALIAAAKGETLTMLLRVARGTGLRAGEICGLRVRSVDLERGQVDVTHQSGGGFTFKPLKTRASRRTIPISADLQTRLKSYIDRSGRGPDEPLFLSSRGLQYVSNNLGREFGKVSDKWTPHSYRHAYASELIDAGLPLPEVARLLGHGSIATTQRVYIHVLPDGDERVRAALSARGM